MTLSKEEKPWSLRWVGAAMEEAVGGEGSDLWGGLWGLHYFGHLNFFPTHQSLIQVM